MNRNRIALVGTIGAGLAAGVSACALGYALWPVLDKSAMNARPAVAQPVIVQDLDANAGAAPAAVAKVIPAAPPAPATSPSPATRSLAALAPPSPDASAPAPSAATTVEPKSPSQSNAGAEQMLASGIASLAGGDIVSARLLLNRAASAGEPRALEALGDSFDPATLARLRVVGVKGDQARAKDFYNRAMSAGVAEARERLADLAAR